MALAAITVTTIDFGAYCGAYGQATSTAGTSLTMPSAAQAPALPYGADQVVKMYQSGISKDVLLNYVNNTVLPYHMNAEDIIYLHNLGMPQEVTQTMIQRDGQLQQQSMQSYSQPPATVAPNSAATTQPMVVTPATPAPDVTVIGGSDYPYIDYGYPYYGYAWPYYGGWPLWYGGWGWGGRGWGWGHGGFGRGGFGHGGGFHGGGGFGGFHGGGGHGGGGHR
jgi:hypothetical protein